MEPEFQMPRTKSEYQKSNGSTTTPRLAVMNLALRGIEADFGPEHADAMWHSLTATSFSFA